MARMQVAASIIEIHWNDQYRAWMVYLDGQPNHGCHFSRERAILHAEGLAEELAR